MIHDNRQVVDNNHINVNSNTLVSVITVVRNCKSTIENTILSIIKQKNIKFEYIIIDGNSNDGTLDVIRKYDKYIDLCISASDSGIYDAMNKGVLHARGNWINFMNSGDSFFDDNTLYKIFCNSNIIDCDVIYGDSIYYYSNFKMLVSPKPLETIKWNLPFCHQSTFVKSSLLKDNLFDLQYRIAADYALFSLLFKQNRKFLYIPLVVANYAIDGGVSSSNIIELFKELEHISRKKNFFEYYLTLTRLSIRNFLFLFLSNEMIRKIRIHKYLNSSNIKLLK